MFVKRPYIAEPGTVVMYTEGDCWLLALHMHKFTGRPMAFANPYPDDLGYWDHVGLQISVNRVLDIEGVFTTKQWKDRWAPAKSYNYPEGGVLYFTAEPLQIEELLVEQTPYFGNIREANRNAKRVAKRLLQTHAPHLI